MCHLVSLFVVVFKLNFDAIMAWSSYSFSRVLDSEIDVEQEIKVGPGNIWKK